ncbi:Tyrosine-protein phosphatase CpsB [Fusobacterium sp. DD29]|uniref:tyrosine-protein phosphatase n=1 Tax=unclassified Fusobacterium TaxID=2648384 RepID=UPI001B8B5121|nr:MULTISPECIES: CpsB/CapC family capsule biosynthesis tyrosine phosphatase [unclassified Fusobacterium]MBR8701379.1 Tyrosine-protein phosphatase CpsB [Fusobacterium sp. DD45]MBR8711147.1 Tyrosine-protein phosphatase CpsB [Fusobacterium sp. DD28]MBR8749900.1 Tyrosine-protein phosphatase CpsB [Fusobacterium sp. DD29]MBR8751696.1 Tyrosine-protein phosphatase CpsB [Fusobacterium sp. DD26]MBR8762156.1 Tyrosine-protein phosphatase CpsB [Fusobacterium sp. DD25]
MIDIHSHILFGLDAGPAEVEESIKLLREAEKIGYTDIVCSSHFYPGIIENENYSENFKCLEKRVKDENISINLYKGNEVVVHHATLSNLKKVNTINNGKYILVELDPGTEYKYCKNFLKKLKKYGYLPVLAHVERYTNFSLKQKIEIYNMGIILQMNIREIASYEQETEYLLTNHYIEVVASDCHTMKDRNYNLQEYLEKLKKLVGAEYFEKITVDIPYKIINNIEIRKSKSQKIFLRRILDAIGIKNI